MGQQQHCVCKMQDGSRSDNHPPSFAIILPFGSKTTMPAASRAARAMRSGMVAILCDFWGGSTRWSRSPSVTGNGKFRVDPSCRLCRKPPGSCMVTTRAGQGSRVQILQDSCRCLCPAYWPSGWVLTMVLTMRANCSWRGKKGYPGIPV